MFDYTSVLYHGLSIGTLNFNASFVMPLTLKKLKGHIALGLSVCVCVCVCVSVRPLPKKKKKKKKVRF